MANQAHPKAVEEWSSEQGVKNLIQLWNTMPTKPETEKLIGAMVENCTPHETIVDLGCGPGRKLTILPDHRSYRGYDISELFIQAAIENYGNDKAHSFQMRSLFDGAPYRKPVDVLLCIDVAQHYADPLGLLKTVMELWPAQKYIFTVLHGPEKQDLLNGYVAATADLERWLSENGVVNEQRDYPLKDFAPLTMRYASFKNR